MTARTGLSTLIDNLRRMTDASTSDYTNGTATFWDGDHMMEVLDRHRIDVNRELLGYTQRYTGGTVSYLDYYSAYRNFEQTTGGTSVFWLEDGTGTQIGTANYTVDYLNGRITFAADTKGTSYYLTGRSYDLNGAASDIWKSKASHYAMAYDIKTDNTSLSRSQLRTQCLEMATYYERIAPVNIVFVGRGDVP